MNFYKCLNFESLTFTRNNKWQEIGNMVFAFSDIPGINIAHCYISAPKGKDFFNLHLYPELRRHVSGVKKLISKEASRALSDTLKIHFGRSLDHFGTHLNAVKLRN